MTSSEGRSQGPSRSRSRREHEEHEGRETVQDVLEEVEHAIKADTYVDEIIALRAEMADMRQLVATIAGLDMVSNAIRYGFDGLRAELGPLRQLVPPSLAQPVDRAVAAGMDGLRHSLDRPSFDNVRQLPIRRTDIPFIGEVELDAPRAMEEAR